MARPMRIVFPGAVYHVTVRGNERKAIVRDNDDRQHFLEVLGQSVLDHGVSLDTFCLMENLLLSRLREELDNNLTPRKQLQTLETNILSFKG